MTFVLAMQQSCPSWYWQLKSNSLLCSLTRQLNYSHYLVTYHSYLWYHSYVHWTYHAFLEFKWLLHRLSLSFYNHRHNYYILFSCWGLLAYVKLLQLRHQLKQCHTNTSNYSSMSQWAHYRVKIHNFYFLSLALLSPTIKSEYALVSTFLNGVNLPCCRPLP
jgi:hypothetical protein